MRRSAFLVVMAVFGAACTDDPTTLSFIVTAPDPPVPIDEVSLFENGFLIGQLTAPVVFPVGGGGWVSFDEQDPFIQMCAVARGAEEDEIFVALADPVMIIPERNVEVLLTLELAEDGEIPSECGGDMVDAGVAALAP